MLFIIRGLPGSGKSTIAKKLLNADAASKHFEADMFFIRDGKYQFDASKIKEAHEWCQKKVRMTLSQGDNVVVSNTFVKQWEVEPYLDMCSELGIDYVIIVATGSYTNVHGVPNDVIDRMKTNWETF